MQETNTNIDKSENDPLTITVPMIDRQDIEFIGANYVCEKALYIAMRMLGLRKNGVNVIEFTIDDTPKECFGRCYPDAGVIIINLERIWQNVSDYVKEADATITLRSGIWIQLLNTIAHEINHMEECLINPDAMMMVNDQSEEERCQKASALAMIELAKNVDIEMPDIFEMPFFGSKIMAEQLMYVNSNEDWAIRQYCMIEDKVVLDNSVGTAYSIREFYRFTAGKDASDLIWGTIPENPAQGAVQNIKDTYEQKLARAQKNVRIHKEKIARAETDNEPEKSNEDPPWDVLKKEEAFKRSQNPSSPPSPPLPPSPPPPPPPPSTPPPPPAKIEETPVYTQTTKHVEQSPTISQMDEDSEFCAEFMDGSFMEGSMQPDYPSAHETVVQSDYPSAHETPTSQPNQFKGRAYQDKLKKAPPYSWEHSAEVMGSVFNQAYTLMVQHIFEKCGWNPSSAVGVRDENDIENQMFDSKYCILEPIDLSHLPAAEELFVSFNSRNELGQTQFDLPCLQKDGRIIVRGEVFDKRQDSSQLPGYAVNINLYCEMVNESGIKETANWVIQRLILPQNPNKRYDDGSLKITAQLARKGEKVAWVMKRGNFGDSKKITHKITCVDNVWMCENL